MSTEFESTPDAPKVYTDGPNQVIPSVNTWTTDRGGNVKLCIGKSGIVALPPISVPGLMNRTVEQYPDHVALQYKHNNKWKNITYREYEKLVRTVAKAFLHLGLEKYHGVGIIGFNSPEWLLSDLGAIFAGGFAVGIYATNNPDACQHCLETSEANICVVEDDKQLQKILQIKNSLPHLKAIIQYSGTPSVSGVLTWQDVIKIGEEQSDEKLNETLKKLAVNECCTLVYTSGTEGKPKAVMLNHDSLTWDAKSIAEHLRMVPGTEVVVSYLPLSHVAAQILDIYTTITVGGKLVFADKDALKGSLVKTLREGKPTIFIGVPRVWEKMYEKMMAVGNQTSGVKKLIATWGKVSSYNHYMNVKNGNKSESWQFKLYRWLIFNQIKTTLGLDRCKYFISAAAPISLEIKKYFWSIDIPITEAFGMSECSGAHAIGRIDDLQLEEIGKALAGVETKVVNLDECGHGEVCIKGRHIFMGYLNEPEKTRNAFDSEGWLHTGDTGIVNEKGHLCITGRIKELLITAGGENIAPVQIEELVKKELLCISNAQLIGDTRKYLSILLTLKTEIDEATGVPLDQLTRDVKDWCRSLGCEVNTVTEVLTKPNNQIFAGIQQGIDRVNEKAISNAQKIQKIAILPADFSTPTGELGPTLKLKRKVVCEKYSKVIDELYSS